MDMFYVEGQCCYVESLLSYVWQFLMWMKKFDVDYIKGICLAIVIEQKVSMSNVCFIVGMFIEIYDYLCIFYVWVGCIYFLVFGVLVCKYEVSDVVDYINSFEEGIKVQFFILLFYKYKDCLVKQEVELLL